MQGLDISEVGGSAEWPEGVAECLQKMCTVSVLEPLLSSVTIRWPPGKGLSGGGGYPLFSYTFM